VDVGAVVAGATGALVAVGESDSPPPQASTINSTAPSAESARCLVCNRSTSFSINNPFCDCQIDCCQAMHGSPFRHLVCFEDRFARIQFTPRCPAGWPTAYGEKQVTSSDGRNRLPVPGVTLFVIGTMLA
jgi:hypothetical protein